MTKDFGHYLLSLNNIYVLSLRHILPSAAASGVSPPKSGYGEERRHGILSLLWYLPNLGRA